MHSPTTILAFFLMFLLNYVSFGLKDIPDGNSTSLSNLNETDLLLILQKLSNISDIAIQPTNSNRTLDATIKKVIDPSEAINNGIDNGTRTNSVTGNYSSFVQTNNGDITSDANGDSGNATASYNVVKPPRNDGEQQPYNDNAMAWFILVAVVALFGGILTAFSCNYGIRFVENYNCNVCYVIIF